MNIVLGRFLSALVSISICVDLILNGTQTKSSVVPIDPSSFLSDSRVSNVDSAIM